MRTFDAAFSPKVAGGWNLHRLMPAEDEAAKCSAPKLVFFSSISALIGTFGQANYAAANAFMDGLARFRTRQGLPGLSVRWGAWADVGMAARSEEVSRMLTRSGHTPLRPQEGVKCLEYLLESGGCDESSGTGGALANPCVADITWSLLLSRLARQQGILSRMAEPREERAHARAARSAQMASAGLKKETEKTVLRVVCAALGTETIGEEEPLADAGMDSLLAVELRNALQREVGVALPATVAYDYPTVRALAQHLGAMTSPAPEAAAAAGEGAEATRATAGRGAEASASGV